MIQIPTTQIPGFYHRRIGDIVVTALSDGYLDGTLEVLQNITNESAAGNSGNSLRGVDTMSLTHWREARRPASVIS